MTFQQLQRLPVSDLLSQAGKTVVVTGGAKGIGRGIGERFAEAGANVVLADIDEVAARVAADGFRTRSGRALAVACDVSDEASVDRAMRQAITQFGNVDVLVNNAGIYPFVPALQMPAAEWDRVQAINLRGLFVCSREFAKHAIQQGRGGVIVNIGSIDSLHPSAVGLAAYDASKGGVLMFTRSFALEMAPYGIRVNMIAPGGITTEGTEQGMSGLPPEEAEAVRTQFVARVPMGRWGVPDDIATVALFLASPASSYMTGSYVVVDGGRLLS